MKELVVLLVAVCTGLLSIGAGGSGEVLFTLREGELKNSQLWREQQLNLFLLQQGE